MPLAPVPPIDPGLGNVPDPADDEAIFDADAFDFTSRMPGFGADIEAIGDATYTNAQWAETKASEAAASASDAADQVTLAADQVTLATNQATLSRDWATSLSVVSGGLYGSRYYAQVAQAAVASLPPGTINDSITTGTDTWSSSKISTEIAASQGAFNFYAGMI